MRSMIVAAATVGAALAAAAPQLGGGGTLIGLANGIIGTPPATPAVSLPDSVCTTNVGVAELAALGPYACINGHCVTTSPKPLAFPSSPSDVGKALQIAAALGIGNQDCTIDSGCPNTLTCLEIGLLGIGGVCVQLASSSLCASS